MATDLTGLASRSSDYVAAMPPAVSGNHGHDATFAVALALCHGFALSNAQALPVMHEFNARCDPPWSERELEHKLESASKVTRHSRQRGYLLGERGPESSAAKAGPAEIVLNVDPDEPLPGEKLQQPQDSEISVANAAKSEFHPLAGLKTPENPALSPEDLAEARRIARELVKLHRDGAIKSERDSSFYANLIRGFGAAYTGTPCDEAARHKEAGGR